MVKFFNQRHVFEHKWEAVTCAVFLKYPNPFSKHVVTADVLERFLDPQTGLLHSKRLLQKVGNMPTWLSRLVSAKISNNALILEESLVDARNGRMSVYTRNLSYQGWLRVEETQEFVRTQEGWTLADVQVKVVGGERAMALGRLIVSKIEGFSINKLKDQLSKSREALLYILEQLQMNKRL